MRLGKNSVIETAVVSLLLTCIGLSAANNVFLSTSNQVNIQESNQLQQVMVCVELESFQSITVTVTVQTMTFPTPNAASEGSDFAPLNEQVTFQAGDESSLTQCIPLTIFGDDAVESEEVLQVLLTNSSISISSPSNQLITIADDDTILIGFEQDEYTASIEGEDVEVCATVLNGTLERMIGYTFDYGDAGTAQSSGEADHISGALSSAFVSSFSRDCVNITTLPDELIEEDEYFFAMITFDGEIFGNVLMTRSEGRTRVTILDDDGAQLSVSVNTTQVPEGDNGLTAVNVCVTLDDVKSGLRRDVLVNLSTFPITAVPGEDFQFQLNTPLVFPASSTLGETVCVPITVIGDVVQEANEVFQVVVTADNRNDVVNSSPVNITILDDGDTVNPQPTGFIIGSTTYPSTVDTNANYLHDPSQGSPLSPKITCPLPTPSSTIDIQWTLTDLSTLRNHTLSTAVCPCDIGGGVFADVVTDGLSSSVVFGPMFPDEGRYTLSCSLLALEHTVTLYNDNPLLDIQNFNADNAFILLNGTQHINIIVLGLFTVANGVTQVATADDYTLEIVEGNGSIRNYPIFAVGQDPNDAYIRHIVVEVNMMSASMNFVLTVQRGSLTANKTFTVITQECMLDKDTYGISWSATPATVTARQRCGRGFIGNASRQCMLDASWGIPDVLGCENVQIANVVDQVETLFENSTTDSELIPRVLPLVCQLSNLTTPISSRLSLLPRDLEDVSMSLANIVDLLVRNGEPISEEDAEEIITVMSNLLEVSNEPGVRSLQQREESSTFSQEVLNTAEAFGLYLAMFLEGSGMDGLVITTNNIVLEARSVTLNATGRNDILFSPDTSLLSSNGSFSSTSQVSARNPYSLLEERANENGVVPVVNILIRNLEEYLPSLENVDQTLLTAPASIILSSQVAIRNGPSESLLVDPFTANFTLDNPPRGGDPFCAFWNFSDPIGNGSWSTANVLTEIIQDFNDTVFVQCSSTHLTSFAILVNVAGDASILNNEALRFVSYIGLGISLVCLLITIIFFLSYGKQLFIAVHNFVHLNLAIALFLADLLFALGVQLAAKNEAACKTVAVLLQYLFLSVFCWMLCEGVMIYLLLWVVFSGLSKKWWFFLLLGWLPPLAFVIIGLATVLDQYGVKGENDELQFCWLSSGHGNHAIWTFVAPMFAVIIINTVFLVLALITVVKNRCGKGQRSEVQNVEKKGKKSKVAISALKAFVILLPLLGLTWVIGIFAVNANTIAFAWIFTILNTLQGVFIFYFHVFRSEKVSEYWKKKFNSIWSSLNEKTMSSSQLKMAGNSSTSGLLAGTLEKTKKTNQEPEKTDLSAVCGSPTGNHECNHGDDGDDNKLNSDLGEIPSLQEASTAV